LQQPDAIDGAATRTQLLTAKYLARWQNRLLQTKEAIMQYREPYTDQKGNKIFLIYKKIQNGAVAKSYMNNGLLIYG
jgi:hypothetical protein